MFCTFGTSTKASATRGAFIYILYSTIVMQVHRYTGLMLQNKQKLHVDMMTVRIKLHDCVFFES